MTSFKSIFNQIEKMVRQSAHYVPRNYKTVGGMWTVDTYKKGNVTLQIMDEGWTIKIFTKDICAIDSGNTFKVERGSLEDFENVLKSIN
ncbi:hypothetical protein D5F11_021550 [Siminovitchia terrae]|uniref:Uncharacterized protein n=1 Tax=Siminovitchia terrae TaxID=1914933 RepID=A0A429X2R5_SIMTE|nr:hypothetical protein [Siminovitchia terrae]RST57648.1 hypothetical protein D5F11_021550 [Siminovitchia terrae]